MGVFNLKFLVTKGGISSLDKDHLIEAYRKLYTSIYGLDPFDSFLEVAYIDSSKYKDNGNINGVRINYERAVNALEVAANNDNIELLLIYENDLLIGAGRLEKVDDVSARILDLVFLELEKEKERQVFVEAVTYVENYFIKEGYQKMAIHIPFQEGTLLMRADKLGFKENPEDIDMSEELRVYIVSKNLESSN